MTGCDFEPAWDESESVHFAHARRHIFAWRGPVNDNHCVQSVKYTVNNGENLAPRLFFHAQLS